MKVVEKSKQIKERSLLFKKVINACSNLLNSNNSFVLETQNYLKSRVVKINQHKYEFGYFPEDKYLDTLTNIVGIETLEKLGIVYTKFFDTHKKTNSVLSKHNLVMPYKDLYGNIIALVGRTLLSSKEQEEQSVPKYKNTSCSKALNLFGLYEAKKSVINKDYVIVVEGQFDRITAAEHGYENVVALGGIGFSKFQFGLIRRYTQNINLMLDSDERGQEASNKIIHRYKKYCNIKKIELPSGYKDVDELLNNSSDYKLIDEVFSK